MARFTREELESFRDQEVPDLLGDDLRLLFVGINPGLWTAATQTHFAHPVNRFYPALQRAGIIDRPISPSDGMTDEDRAAIKARGVGITNLVRRATAKASELTSAELEEGGGRLRALVRERRPRVVAIAGITAYRTAFGDRHATPGRQPEPLEGAELWVVPNPSGLNAHETVDSLATAYAAPARAAGILAVVVALLLLAGCGDRSEPTEASPQAGTSSATSSSDSEWRQLDMVAITTDGLQPDTELRPVQTAPQREALVAGADNPEAVAILSGAVADATLEDGERPMAAVVAVGCDPPASITVDTSTDPPTVIPGKPARTTQCFAAQAFLALVAVRD